MNNENNNVNQDEILDAESIFNQPLNSQVNPNNVGPSVNPNVNPVPNSGVVMPDMSANMNMGVNTMDNTVSNQGVVMSDMSAGMNMGVNPMDSSVSNQGVVMPDMSSNMNVGVNPMNGSVSNPGMVMPDMGTNMNMGVNSNVNSVSNSGVVMPNMNDNQIPNNNMSTQMMNMQPLLEPTNIQAPVLNEEPSSKKKKSKLPIVLLIVLLLVVGLLVGGFFYLKSVNVFNKFINNGFNTVYEGLLADSVSTKSTYKVNIEARDVDSNTQELLDVINKMTLFVNSSVDVSNNIADYDISAKYDNKSLIDLNMYLKDDVYVYLNGVYDKYIRIPLEKQQGLTIQDERVLITSIKNALNKAIDNKYIDRKLDGTKWKNTLVIDSKNALEITKTFISTLANDSDFISVLSKVDSDLGSEFKNVDLSVLDSEFDYDGTIYIDFYTSMISSDFISASISVSYENVNLTDLVSVDKNGNGYDITVNIPDSDNIVMKVSKSISGNDTSYVVQCNYSGVDVKFEVTSNVTNGVSVPVKDVSNSVYYEDLTDSDMDLIEQNLMNNSALASIVEVIGGYAGSLFGGYDDDYDYGDYDFEYNDEYDFKFDFNEEL